jgi:hypothetical protein
MVQRRCFDLQDRLRSLSKKDDTLKGRAASLPWEEGAHPMQRDSHNENRRTQQSKVREDWNEANGGWEDFDDRLAPQACLRVGAEGPWHAPR